MLVQWFKSFATLHRSIIRRHLWKCPKYWFGVTNKFRWVDRFANTKSTNKEDWRSVYSTRRGPMIQFLLPSLLYNINKLFILSVWWLPLYSIYWIAIEPSRHMSDYFLHRDFPKPRLKMNCFFSTLSPFPWPPATCLSLPQMMAMLLDHRAVLPYSHCLAWFFLFTFFGSTDCYFLSTIAYGSCVAVCQPLLYVTTVTPKGLFVSVTRASLMVVFRALVMKCLFLPNIPHHFAYSANVMLI